jgi:hypothetical protein
MVADIGLLRWSAVQTAGEDAGSTVTPLSPSGHRP